MDMETKELLRKVLVGITTLFLVISVWRLYSSLNSVITIWVGGRWVPVYFAMLNLAVAILALYVLKLLVQPGD